MLNDKEFLELIEGKIKEKGLKEDEIVKGVVVKVDDREVFIDVGGKAEGILPKDEFRNQEVKPGDEVYVYIEAVDSKEGLKISKKKADFELNWEKIKDAYENNTTVEAKVIGQVKGGLIVDVFGVEAFLPGSQVDRKRIRNFQQFIGKTIPVKIIKVNKQRKNVIVSRLEVLEEQEELSRQRLKELKVGDVIEGTVKNVVEFGIFVDLGNGLEGLVHISEVSWTKVDNLHELYRPGDKVKVQILEIDPDKKKVSLSIKRLQPHPWEEVAKKYPIGSRVRGRVKKIVDYGFFVELEPGVEGLVHISEMKWGRPPAHPSEMVKEGDEVELVVLNVDVERQRISLGMKQTQPDPWAIIEEKYPVGSVVKGKVVDFDNFGAFVEIEPDIQGYIHVSNMSWTKRINSPQDILKKGQKVKALVKEIDKKQRILELSLKDLTPNPWEQIEKQLKPGTEIRAKILRVLDKGVIVDVYDGIEGFVPINQLQKKGSPKENYQEGDDLNLVVQKVEPRRKRILLSEREYYRRQAKKEEEKRKAKAVQEPSRVNLGEILSKELQKLQELIGGEESEG